MKGNNLMVLDPFFPVQLDLGIPAMTKCCNQLDTCYDTCGANKYRCDAKFRWCLQSICSDLKRSLGFVSKVEGECSTQADFTQTDWEHWNAWVTSKG